VAAYRGPVGLALAVALGLSQPLLVIHLARVFDPRFAARLGLPLSLFTLGGVVAGVYLEGQRPYVFLGVGMIAIAVLTLTYRRWTAQRQAWRLGEQRAAERAAREKVLAKPEAEEARAQLAEAMAAARQPLVRPEGDGEAHARWSREALGTLAARLEAV